MCTTGFSYPVSIEYTIFFFNAINYLSGICSLSNSKSTWVPTTKQLSDSRRKKKKEKIGKEEIKYKSLSFEEKTEFKMISKNISKKIK